MEFEDLENEIDKLKDEFYSSSSKNIFFKSKQKFECATQIMAKVPLEALLYKTCRYIPSEHLIYIDYTIFKSYATPEIFNTITDYIILVFSEFIQKYGCLEIALNLDTFTVSACERYKTIIQIFCDKCFQQQNNFTHVLRTFRIYNMPSTFETIKQIMSPFLLEEVKAKIQLFGKADSSSVLCLFA
jgi:hypothetical protein